MAAVGGVPGAGAPSAEECRLAYADAAAAAVGHHHEVGLATRRGIRTRICLDAGLATTPAEGGNTTSACAASTFTSVGPALVAGCDGMRSYS